MKVELAIISLLFVAFVATLFGTQSSSTDVDNASPFPMSLASYFPDSEVEGRVLPGMKSVDERLRSRWRLSRAKGRVFSRGEIYNHDTRARRDLYVPVVRFSEQQQSNPNSVFSGSFDLTRNETTLSFPLIYDRRTGDAFVFAKNEWRNFEKWLVSKQGVHL